MPQAGALRIDTLAVVETPEGIGLSLQPAGLVARTMAFLLDLLIRLGLDLIILMVLSRLEGLGVGLSLIGMFCVEWIYPIVFELGRSGATPGKSALGLRVVMDSGLPITPAASFTRNLLRVADFLPVGYGFAIVSVLLNSECKRLGDLAAGTLVVHDRPLVLHDAPPDAEALAPARPLNLREQAAIRSCAGRVRRLTPARFEELAQMADSALPAVEGASASQRLLSVGQWLLGKKPS